MRASNLPRPYLKSGFFLLISLVFVVGGVWMIGDGQNAGWFVTLFFGLCVAVFAAMMFGPFGVAMDEQGFEMKSPLSNKRWAWKDVSDFEVVGIGRTRMIVFDDAQSKRRILNAANRMLVGRNSAIPASLIGGSLEKACGELNERRARALGLIK